MLKDDQVAWFEALLLSLNIDAKVALLGVCIQKGQSGDVPHSIAEDSIPHGLFNIGMKEVPEDLLLRHKPAP